MFSFLKKKAFLNTMLGFESKTYSHFVIILNLIEYNKFTSKEKISILFIRQTDFSPWVLSL